jgi:hypothetical protein
VGGWTGFNGGLHVVTLVFLATLEVEAVNQQMSSEKLACGWPGKEGGGKEREGGKSTGADWK